MAKKGRASQPARVVAHGQPEPALGAAPAARQAAGGNGQARAGAAGPLPPPARRFAPADGGADPDRVIEPETSPPEPRGTPDGEVAASRRQPAGQPATGAVVARAGATIDRHAAQPVRLRADVEVTPSWGSVVHTTVRLWAQRRTTRWRVAAAILAALVLFAAGGLTVALVHSLDSRNAGSPGAPGTAGLGAVSAAAAARQQAAVWVAAQVSHSAVVSCDPAMCAALQAKGFPAGDLMALGPAAADPLGSAVIVSTETVRSEFGSRLTSVYAPTAIASFGSGAAQVDVRVYAAGGAAAYLGALRADEQARRSAGSQLLRNPRISAAPAARRELADGQVDSRLLITIATLAGQGPVSIAAFGDSGPRASPGTPLRLAELASPPGAKSGYLQSLLALLRAQQQPYRADSLTLTRLGNGQQGVRIEFAAPSPLGLLNG
jgi:hypothetical protein